MLRWLDIGQVIIIIILCFCWARSEVGSLSSVEDNGSENVAKNSNNYNNNNNNNN